jgi:hypothetical protein
MMVTLLPIMLAPTFLAAAVGEGASWSAYFNAVVVSLVYGMLASVQSTLDDPFGYVDRLVLVFPHWCSVVQLYRLCHLCKLRIF